jgi:hypothetical protein
MTDMTSPRAPLVKLIDQIIAANREYFRLRFDKAAPDKLGNPASEKQIAGLERALGWKLPPSYRAFLELHDGWSKFDGDGKLLSIEDQGSKWVKSRIGDFNELFAEDDDESPFDVGALPIMMGQHINHFVVIDPRKPKGGEMRVVAYDYATKEKTFKDFTAYLTYTLSIVQELAEEERSGTAED